MTEHASIHAALGLEDQRKATGGDMTQQDASALDPAGDLISREAALLPCPFCGGTDITDEAFWIASPVEWFGKFKCNDCDTDGPLSQFKYDDRAEAVEDAKAMWNRRALPAAPEAGEVERMLKDQLYRYIGKDGKTVLARDLEDSRDDWKARSERAEASLAAMTANAEALGNILWMAEEWFKHGGDETTDADEFQEDLRKANEAQARILAALSQPTQAGED